VSWALEGRGFQPPDTWIANETYPQIVLSFRTALAVRNLLLGGRDMPLEDKGVESSALQDFLGVRRKAVSSPAEAVRNDMMFEWGPKAGHQS
jgi:hypothetical protein